MTFTFTSSQCNATLMLFWQVVWPIILSLVYAFAFRDICIMCICVTMQRGRLWVDVAHRHAVTRQYSVLPQANYALCVFAEQ